VVSFRIERVQELLKEVISEVMRELKDPRVGFATITDVVVSPDLRHAKIYVSILGKEEDRQGTMIGLNNARGFIRREISKNIRLKHIPDLTFHFDESIERGVRVVHIIHEVMKADAASEEKQQ
jgi:ribosome-binding factor A